MFHTKTRHSSVSNLLQVHNPQASSKASSRKHIFVNQQSDIKQSNLKQKPSPLLPKIKNPIKTNSTTSQFFESKKQQKTQMKQLSLAISRYYLHRGQYAKKPFNQLSFDVMSIIQCLSMVQNNFKQIFAYIYEDLKIFLYCTTNAELVQKYQIKEGQLYKKIVQEIDENVNKKLKQLYRKLRQATDAKQQIEIQYERQKINWAQKQKKFLEQLEWLKKISNNEYVNYLKEQLQQKIDRIQELQQSQRSLVLLRDEYQKQIQKQKHIIEDQIKQKGRLNTIIYDLKLGKIQSQTLFVKLRDRFDQFNLKMNGIKEIIQDVQKQNQQLKTQRVSLFRRAAVSFQELTPRPKYKKILNFNQKQLTMTLKPTMQLTQILLQKIGLDAFKEQFRIHLFDQKLSSKKQIHPKLQQAEKIRLNTQFSITESKSQIKEIKKKIIID